MSLILLRRVINIQISVGSHVRLCRWVCSFAAANHIHTPLKTLGLCCLTSIIAGMLEKLCSVVAVEWNEDVE
jgi:ribose/xylose/arabinose/galactoside ABC-type transport system permease subunit